MNYPTPHINAKPGDFAKTVLMPGDPLRSKFIAENFLTDARLVNNVRGVQGYTGSYDGKKVSVMASGMGMPSMGIYSYELFNVFGVENIIRIGSCGALSERVRIRDIIIGMGACTNSNFASQYRLNGTFAPICDFELMSRAVSECERLGARFHVGNIVSTDTFYSADQTLNAQFAGMGVLGAEMEAAALYMTAAYSKKRALAICTVSDHILTGEATTAAERETSFTQMMEVALKTAAAMENE
ncbi:MAG: purine-nucleoside phosphorylase [Clostridia bacterium]|nr:purine-nucleoside phosphorylase [Clostridia bacterium]